MRGRFGRIQFTMFGQWMGRLDGMYGKMWPGDEAKATAFVEQCEQYGMQCGIDRGGGMHWQVSSILLLLPQIMPLLKERMAKIVPFNRIRIAKLRCGAIGVHAVPVVMLCFYF
jgi:hypothetical protein